VGDLGDVLELMATARRRYRTLQATLHESCDERIARRDDESPGHARAAISELFVAYPDRLRIERRGLDGSFESLVVLDGWQRSTYSADWGAEVREQSANDVRWALGAAGELLDPMRLIGVLEILSVERDRRDGRDVFRLYAKPRFALPRALGTADFDELVVDAERGVVVELVGFIGASPARTLELRGLRFDAEPAAETFVLTVPPEEEVSGLGLRDAARMASFPLWALPRPAQQITYRGARPSRGRPESVTIDYADVLLVETRGDEAVAVTAYAPPRSVDRGGRSYVVLPGRAIFTLDGTTISMTATDADDETLLDLAEALVPLEA
jgi:hypothetical protein